MVSEFGLTLTSVCAHANLLDPTSPDRYGTAEIIKAIKLAHFLGVKQVITTEGDPKTDFGHQLSDGQRLFSIRLGHIGVGGQGTGLLQNFLSVKGATCAAIADPFRQRREAAAERVKTAQGHDPKLCNDFRELLADDSIDAVIIATPDALFNTITSWDPKLYQIQSPAELNSKMSHQIRGPWRQS